MADSLRPLERGAICPRSGAVAYLFSACLCCSLLGAFLTFAPVGLYPAYLNPPAAISSGLDPKSDQQLGGLLMWVPGCFVYLTGILATVRRWYAEEVRGMSGPPVSRPIVLAAGVMLTLWGAASTWIVSVVGLIVIGHRIGALVARIRNEKFEMKLNPWIHRFAIFVGVRARSSRSRRGAIVTSLERPIAANARGHHQPCIRVLARSSSAARLVSWRSPSASRKLNSLQFGWIAVGGGVLDGVLGSKR